MAMKPGNYHYQCFDENQVLSVEEIKDFFNHGCSVEKFLQSIMLGYSGSASISGERLNDYYKLVDDAYNRYDDRRFIEKDRPLYDIPAFLSEPTCLNNFDSLFTYVRAFNLFVNGANRNIAKTRRFDIDDDFDALYDRNLRANLCRALEECGNEIPSMGVKIFPEYDDVTLFLSLGCDYSAYFHTMAKINPDNSFYRNLASKVENGTFDSKTLWDIKRLGEYRKDESVLITADRLAVLYDMLHPGYINYDKDMNHLRALTKLAISDEKSLYDRLINTTIGYHLAANFRDGVGYSFKIEPDFKDSNLGYSDEGVGSNYSNPTNSTTGSKPTSSKTDDGTFVVVSDFHNVEWPVKKIQDYYVKEYDKIYILGDATDRGIDRSGTGSIALLRTIKALCDQYPDKVVYLAGNHDDFLYKYMDDNDTPQKGVGQRNLLHNGQTGTISEVDELRRSDPVKFAELREWLGSRKLQAVHKYDGKTYYLAHAIFNKKAYDNNPDLCLRDNYLEYGKQTPLERQIYSILWYRPDEPDLVKLVIPSELAPGGPNNIMVTGHTPYLGEYTVTGSNGENLDAHIVDSDMAYSPEQEMMKKFSNGVMTQTEVSFHNPPAR